MRDYYGVLNRIIEQELKKKKNIAIFPMGRVGTYAKIILRERFGQTGIYIDNNVCNYNSEIVDTDSFLRNNRLFDITLIICFDDWNTNTSYIDFFQSKSKELTVRSCMEYDVFEQTGTSHIMKEIKSLCKVRAVNGVPLVRVGKHLDGGYVMLDDFVPECKAYSFGIGNDVSWDEDIAGRGVPVVCFDHTIDSLPPHNEKLFFIKGGIGGTVNRSYNIFSIDEIMRREGDCDNVNLILKMDVEGAEWEFLSDVTDEVLLHFRQMTFELHEMANKDMSKTIIKCLKKINKNHQAVWVHANNAGGLTKDGDEEMPSLLEITFARRDLYDFCDISYSSPTGLDSPNLRDFIEIPLRGWGTND